MARIAVIEDNATSLDLMTYLLAGYGHKPVPFRNGISGLEAVQRDPPDVVLCDIQLPGISGLEVARLLRAQPRFDRLPLVAVTALAMRGDKEKVLASGFDGYIEKPIQPETFVQEVEAYLPPSHRPQNAGDMGTPAPAPAPAPELDRDRRPVVLAVDNVAANLELAKTILEHGGYRVLLASGVRAARAILRRRPVDVVLSDVHMPEGGGFALCWGQDVSAAGPNIAFAFISSSALTHEERNQARQLSVRALLQRPIDPSDLLDTVDACLPPAAPRPVRTPLA